MATSLTICNSALIKLGAEVISSLSDNNKRAILCNTQYETLKNKVLRAHPWNFAIARAQLVSDITVPSWGFNSAFVLPVGCLRVIDVRYDYEYSVEGSLLLLKEGYTEIVTDEVEAASTTTIINATAHEVLANDIVLINSERRLVASITDNTFTLATALSGAPSATDEIVVYRPAEVFIRYIADVDEALFTDDFAEALAHYIAYELAYSLVQSKELRNENFQLYQEMVRSSRNFDAQEGTPEDFRVETFTNARL